ncbi:DNA-binding transcriptional regulator, XRE-family HTH domain [Amycolatopsis marina]|uniref:DNA-binding transcriptional regulator, XRE-family HTH domain n=1 Tax=Amycolatopsis marina TaxID=490629 RepID=A0A1I1CF94_9PSEU|nr:helix-turn-helix transcriptional regulator [Amycolatopsis marina]SFB59103.1 DNA-binding transcriptional regulator, XRE-family HTH domain [Amycolatopsis marina]
MVAKRQRLAQRRKSLGFTQEGLAERLGIDPTTVRRWESGGAERGPQPWLRPKLARVLQVSAEQLDDLLAEADTPRTNESLQRAANVESSMPDVTHVVPSQAVLAVMGPSQTLVSLDVFTQSLIARYELEGPQQLVAEARALRQVCHQLGGSVSGTEERTRLARVSAQQSALLAYMSVNLSQYKDAEQYALEASLLATAIRDWPLLAWIKGTQSFTAYYQEKYDDALNLARVGLQFAGDDAQRIRLLANGVARAAGKLGDRRTVDQAVTEAFELVADRSGPTGMTPCIDFAPYRWARTAANAATAYLSVGDYKQALKLTQDVSATVASSDSDWSRSLVHLDEASALTLGRQADLEHAASIGKAALAASATKPIASIHSRAAELAVSMRRRGTNRAGQDFAAALHEWKQRRPEVTT